MDPGAKAQKGRIFWSGCEASIQNRKICRGQAVAIPWRCIMDHNRLIATARSQEESIGAPGDCGRLARAVKAERFLPGGCIPDLDGLVVARRSQPCAIGAPGYVVHASGVSAKDLR